MKSFPIFSFIKSMNVIPTFYFGRAVVKLSKMKGFPQNLKFYIFLYFLDGNKDEMKIPETKNAKIIQDLQFLAQNDNEQDEEPIYNNKNKITISKIETFPDLLTEDDLVNAVQKLTPTIDQIFVKNLKETGQLDEQKWQKLKKKLRILPSSSLIKITKTFSDFPKFHKMNNVWMPLENEFSDRLQKMTFNEIVKMLWCFAYSNRKNREFFRMIENELYDREWKYAHIK